MTAWLARQPHIAGFRTFTNWKSVIRTCYDRTKYDYNIQNDKWKSFSKKKFLKLYRCAWRTFAPHCNKMEYVSENALCTDHGYSDWTKSVEMYNICCLFSIFMDTNIEFAFECSAPGQESENWHHSDLKWHKLCRCTFKIMWIISWQLKALQPKEIETASAGSLLLARGKNNYPDIWPTSPDIVELHSPTFQSIEGEQHETHHYETLNHKCLDTWRKKKFYLSLYV